MQNSGSPQSTLLTRNTPLCLFKFANNCLSFHFSLFCMHAWNQHKKLVQLVCLTNTKVTKAYKSFYFTKLLAVTAIFSSLESSFLVFGPLVILPHWSRQELIAKPSGEIWYHWLYSGFNENDHTCSTELHLSPVICICIYSAILYRMHAYICIVLHFVLATTKLLLQHRPTQSLQHGPSSWPMEDAPPTPTLVVWRSSWTECGAQSVDTPGILQSPVLSAVSWGFRLPNQWMQATMVQEEAESGWPTCRAVTRKMSWGSALTTKFKDHCRTAIIMMTLEWCVTWVSWVFVKYCIQ